MHMGELILQKLKAEERSVAWLADKAGCNAANLGRQLKDNQDIHPNLLRRISRALKTNFFVYYAEDFAENFAEEKAECKNYSKIL